MFACVLRCCFESGGSTWVCPNVAHTRGQAWTALHRSWTGTVGTTADKALRDLWLFDLGNSVSIKCQVDNLSPKSELLSLLRRRAYTAHADLQRRKPLKIWSPKCQHRFSPFSSFMQSFTNMTFSIQVIGVVLQNFEILALPKLE